MGASVAVIACIDCMQAGIHASVIVSFSPCVLLHSGSAPVSPKASTKSGCSSASSPPGASSGAGVSLAGPSAVESGACSSSGKLPTTKDVLFASLVVFAGLIGSACGCPSGEWRLQQARAADGNVQLHVSYAEHACVGGA